MNIFVVSHIYARSDIHTVIKHYYRLFQFLFRGSSKGVQFFLFVDIMIVGDDLRF